MIKLFLFVSSVNYIAGLLIGKHIPAPSYGKVKVTEIIGIEKMLKCTAKIRSSTIFVKSNSNLNRI